MNRQTRLQLNKIIGFHETSYESVDPIIKSQKMKVGKEGLAGGGIYFAVNAQDAHRKTEHRGVILKGTILLGNVLKWKNTKEFKTMTYEKLKKKGYDSVVIPRERGNEYVVYRPDQVKDISISVNQGSLRENVELKDDNVMKFYPSKKNILYSIPLHILKSVV